MPTPAVAVAVMAAMGSAGRAGFITGEKTRDRKEEQEKKGWKETNARLPFSQV